jgi:hypothetical protein
VDLSTKLVERETRGLLCLAALRLVILGVHRAHEEPCQPGKHQSEDCQDDEHLSQREAVLCGPETI